MSWEEMSCGVLRLAEELIDRGVRHGERIALLGSTSVEWTMADCAILAAGAVCVPIYLQLTAEQIAHILRDSRPKLLFAEEGAMGKLSAAMKITSREIPVLPLERVLAEASGPRGGPPVGRDVMAVVADLEMRDEATIVYTSGTTGVQKGVVLTHGNLAAEIRGARRAFDFGDDDVGLAFLPLAHVLGRMMQFYSLSQGCETAYAEGIAELPRNYVEVRPHFLCAVPRMLEKVHELVEARVRELPAPAGALFRWALSTGKQRSSLLQKHRRVPAWLFLKAAVADMLVFRRVRKRLGGRMRAYICGGAPLSEDVARFFHAAGIMVLEGWGLTETFAAVTVNRSDDFHFGTVGKPLSGAELDIAPDGEILVRGALVFKEYLNLPGETRAAFDERGFFRTGDLGEISRDGFLRITGRKKDIIITAGGKNVAPQMIEGMLSKSPYVNHAMVCGDGRKYLTALFTLNRGAVIDYLAERGVTVVEGELLSANPAVVGLIDEHVREQNRSLASYETIKRFAIIDDEFSIEGGELTPTLKMRREAVTRKYREALDSLYSS